MVFWGLYLVDSVRPTGPRQGNTVRFTGCIRPKFSGPPSSRNCPGDIPDHPVPGTDLGTLNPAQPSRLSRGGTNGPPGYPKRPPNKEYPAPSQIHHTPFPTSPIKSCPTLARVRLLWPLSLGPVNLALCFVVPFVKIRPYIWCRNPGGVPSPAGYRAGRSSPPPGDNQGTSTHPPDPAENGDLSQIEKRLGSFSADSSHYIKEFRYLSQAYDLIWHDIFVVLSSTLTPDERERIQTAARNHADQVQLTDNSMPVGATAVPGTDPGWTYQDGQDGRRKRDLMIQCLLAVMQAAAHKVVNFEKTKRDNPGT
ncbi:uncharacterized protein [Tursiops truncatus]|uniref:uncharacterized protein n=1 Tax=Tursiops truncatus TaxID=9739 RepID=UPI003CCF5911